jgi:hypothetical protein
MIDSRVRDKTWSQENNSQQRLNNMSHVSLSPASFFDNCEEKEAWILYSELCTY